MTARQVNMTMNSFAILAGNSTCNALVFMVSMYPTPSLLKPSIYCILASVDAVRGILSTPLLNCIDSNSLDSMLHLSTVSIDLEFAANVQLVAAWNHQTKDAPATCRISSSTGNGWSMALVFRESAAMIP